ncbi:MAG: hypothetical protein K2L82_13570 [Lachnospiraceae bacterium]|nr:hypothetical protein [Lachnospiraceae bacterium]
MKRMIVKKGSYGYIENRKVVTALRTLLFFAVCIGLYVMGYLTTGTSKNLLTIVAVLGCLPSCKSMVNLIMFLKAKGCGEALKNQVCVYDEKLTTFYDMYFTSYQKNFPISHMALKGNVLCGIAENPKCDCNGAEKHLEQMLTQEGIKNMTVKIFSQPEKYTDRLSQLTKLSADEHKNRDGIINLLYSISI